MIQTKKDLKFYIAADRIMNGYPLKRSIITRIHESMAIGGAKVIVIKYLYHLRKYAYYYNTQSHSFCNKVMMLYEHWRLSRYALKTSFSIGQNSLGYGVILPHYGTIVVNENSHVGPFSVLHTSTCIAGGGQKYWRGILSFIRFASGW